MLVLYCDNDACDLGPPMRLIQGEIETMRGRAIAGVCASCGHKLFWKLKGRSWAKHLEGR